MAHLIALGSILIAGPPMAIVLSAGGAIGSKFVGALGFLKSRRQHRSHKNIIGIDPVSLEGIGFVNGMNSLNKNQVFNYATLLAGVTFFVAVTVYARWQARYPGGPGLGHEQAFYAAARAGAILFYIDLINRTCQNSRIAAAAGAVNFVVWWLAEVKTQFTTIRISENSVLEPLKCLIRRSKTVVDCRAGILFSFDPLVGRMAVPSKTHILVDWVAFAIWRGAPQRTFWCYLKLSETEATFTFLSSHASFFKSLVDCARDSASGGKVTVCRLHGAARVVEAEKRTAFQLGTFEPLSVDVQRLISSLHLDSLASWSNGLNFDPHRYISTAMCVRSRCLYLRGSASSGRTELAITVAGMRSPNLLFAINIEEKSCFDSIRGLDDTPLGSVVLIQHLDKFVSIDDHGAQESTSNGEDFLLDLKEAVKMLVARNVTVVITSAEDVPEILEDVIDHKVRFPQRFYSWRLSETAKERAQVTLRVARKVLVRGLHKTMANGFQAWAIAVARCRDQERAARRVVGKLLRLKTGAAMMTWLQLVHDLKLEASAAESKNRAMRNALFRIFLRFKVVAFRKWQALINFKQEKARQSHAQATMAEMRMTDIRRCTRRVVVTVVSKRLRSSFNTWVYFVRHFQKKDAARRQLESKQQKDAITMNRVCLKIVLTSLRVALETWVGMVKMARAGEVDAARKAVTMRRILSGLAKSSLSQGFRTWSLTVYELKIEEERARVSKTVRAVHNSEAARTFRAIVVSMVGSKIRLAWFLWRGYTLRKHFDEATQKSERAATHSVLAAKDVVVVQQLRGVVIRMAGSSLRMGWFKWRSFVVAQQQTKTSDLAQIKAAEMAALRGTFETRIKLLADARDQQSEAASGAKNRAAAAETAMRNLETKLRSVELQVEAADRKSKTQTQMNTTLLKNMNILSERMQITMEELLQARSEISQKNDEIIMLVSIPNTSCLPHKKNCDCCGSSARIVVT